MTAITVIVLGVLIGFLILFTVLRATATPRRHGAHASDGSVMTWGGDSGNGSDCGSGSSDGGCGDGGGGGGGD